MGKELITVPKLDPELKEQIEHYLHMDYITEAQSKILKSYFIFGNYPEAAIKIGMKKSSFIAVMSVLKQRNVLIRVGKGKYVLTDDETSIIMPYRKPEELPDPPLQMSEEEKEWMLQYYGDYKNNRSEAARILKRSKFDICRMAIELHLDSDNRRRVE
ncbi:hypothetical protein AK95_14740 [Paenibacillus sp. LC231]|uniref:hypothetical protein n=1 Tax=Paenibacillus sp. LC231 TaxID=1120679 RepID=UPI0008DD9C93|nr:hypothetical protein [Paenibacillus sp. LC231]OIB04869.1 hypothetical protein AK95_14740 [Paenibacillus sp. LC231]